LYTAEVVDATPTKKSKTLGKRTPSRSVPAVETDEDSIETTPAAMTRRSARITRRSGLEEERRAIARANSGFNPEDYAYVSDEEKEESVQEEKPKKRGTAATTSTASAAAEDDEDDEDGDGDGVGADEEEEGTTASANKPQYKPLPQKELDTLLTVHNSPFLLSKCLDCSCGFDFLGSFQVGFFG